MMSSGSSLTIRNNEEVLNKRKNGSDVEPEIKKAKVQVKILGFQVVVSSKESSSLLEMKEIRNEGKGVYGFRYLHNFKVEACVKVQVSQRECRLSCCFGDFDSMNKNERFYVFISMLKDFLFDADICSIQLVTSKDDYEESMGKKCLNSFEIIACPDEWKAKSNYKLHRKLMKTEGIGNLDYFFTPSCYEPNNANIITMY